MAILLISISKKGVITSYSIHYTKLYEILSNIDGVDSPVVQIFCVDLLEQTLSRVYSVEEVDGKNTDFMYG